MKELNFYSKAPNMKNLLIIIIFSTLFTFKYESSNIHVEESQVANIEIANLAQTEKISISNVMIDIFQIYLK